jgi:hypothetical protein
MEKWSNFKVGKIEIKLCYFLLPFELHNFTQMSIEPIKLHKKNCNNLFMLLLLW